MSAGLITTVLIVVSLPIAYDRTGGVITATAQEWNAEGVYEWNIQELGSGGTLSIFKRPNGSWGGHGTFGGPSGEVLMVKDVVVGRTGFTATADGPSGVLKFAVEYKNGTYVCNVMIVEIGFMIGATIKRVGA